MYKIYFFQFNLFLSFVNFSPFGCFSISINYIISHHQRTHMLNKVLSSRNLVYLPSRRENQVDVDHRCSCCWCRDLRNYLLHFSIPWQLNPILMVMPTMSSFPKSDIPFIFIFTLTVVSDYLCNCEFRDREEHYFRDEIKSKEVRRLWLNYIILTIWCFNLRRWNRSFV